MNTIKIVEDILKKEGFTYADYILSLQGPSVVLTQSGNIKMNQEIRSKLKDLIKVI
jgi:arginine/ornithine N-succinyltransferase beta subunit